MSMIKIFTVTDTNKSIWLAVTKIISLPMGNNSFPYEREITHVKTCWHQRSEDIYNNIYKRDLIYTE